ncbi:MAG: N-6 DNA methylase, partial [Pseudobdellovibrionaceae bacterium]
MTFSLPQMENTEKTNQKAPPPHFEGYIVQCPPGLGRLLSKEMMAHKIVPFKDRIFMKFQRNHDLLFMHAVEKKQGLRSLRIAERVLEVPAYGKYKISKNQLDAIASRLKKLTEPHRLVIGATGKHFQRQDLQRWLLKEMEKREIEFSFDEEDPEVWLLTVDELFYFGIPIFREDDAALRNHRTEERDGSLPPTAAAAMAFLAKPLENENIWDPCCGSGTLLAEAFAYTPKSHFIGTDIDTTAIAIAKNNLSHLPNLNLQKGDHSKSGLADRSVQVVLANLPFGKKYGSEGAANEALYTKLLHEIKRVADP